MKLKSLIAAALLVTSISTYAVDLTVSPLYTVIGLVRTAVAIVVTPTALAIGSSEATTAANKEQLAAVRSDAVDFLAGAEASDVLSASIKQIKGQNDEMNALSDTQVASLIVTALE
jgi:hypothetical protein